MAWVCADADLVEVSLQGLTRRLVSISSRRPHPPWRGRVSGSSGGIFACPATRTQLFEGSRWLLPPLAVLVWRFVVMADEDEPVQRWRFSPSSAVSNPLMPSIGCVIITTTRRSRPHGNDDGWRSTVSELGFDDVADMRSRLRGRGFGPLIVVFDRERMISATCRALF